MMQLNSGKTALVFGATLGAFHLGWSLLVLFGVGQWLLDLVFWMHMLSMPIVVGPFSLAQAAALVAFTAVWGAVMGLVFARLWNYFHRA